MKLLFSILMVGSLPALGQGKNGFEIRGQISNAEGKKIYIAPTAQATALDSAVISKGRFTLRGNVKEPDHYALVVEGKPAYTWFILSNAPLTFKGNADSLRQASISGSKELADAGALRAVIKPFLGPQSASFDSAFAAYNRGDSVKGMTYEKMNLSLTKRINDSIARFIQTHPSSYISLAQLNELYKFYGRARSRELYYCLSPVLQKHSVGRQLKYELFEADRLTALNQDAILFQQADSAGQLVRLSDYKGHYVLIDFWASWCLPCRAENPAIKKAYAQYRSRGFEVLGVSLDNNRAAWVKALGKDALPWKNVSDLNGFKNSVAQQYAVTELPTNYLLDPKGKIIARNLKGDRLLAYLHSIFGD